MLNAIGDRKLTCIVLMGGLLISFKFRNDGGFYVLPGRFYLFKKILYWFKKYSLRIYRVCNLLV